MENEEVFRFPNILKESAKQTDAFKPVVELIDGVMNDGLKCSIFAYGQTGAGKTYTLSGGAFKNNGIIQQTINYIVEQGKANGLKVEIRCQLIQIYKSDLVDLFLPHHEHARYLTVGMDEENCPTVVGATKIYVADLISSGAKHLIRTFNQGLDNRLMRSTEVNETSSRSHLLFFMVV